MSNSQDITGMQSNKLTFTIGFFIFIFIRINESWHDTEQLQEDYCPQTELIIMIIKS